MLHLHRAFCASGLLTHSPPVAPLYACLQAKQQLAQLMWLRQSEDVVLEALARLTAVGEDVRSLLGR